MRWWFRGVIKDQQRNFVLIPSGRRGTTVLPSKVEGIPDDTALSEGQSHFYDIISAIDFVNKNKKPAYMGSYDMVKACDRAIIW